MISYKDRAYCASPECKNECGRKITEEERQEAIKAELAICYGYFCGGFVMEIKNE